MSYLFDRKGVFTIDKTYLQDRDLEELEMELIDGGLEEMTVDEDLVIVYTSFDDFGKMQKLLEQINIEVSNTEVQRIPNSTNVLNIDDAKRVLLLIDKMEEDDDVSSVYHNLEMTGELLAALEEE